MEIKDGMVSMPEKEYKEKIASAKLWAMLEGIGMGAVLMGLYLLWSIGKIP
ncbi:hypothetical protein [Methanococcoides burtonii]|uniref:hypothetical protein n=1 Tax=Methanococcoides burtonii TaxID=29291 RepID=UPI000039935B|nr:hypothetical protein [Methanococcoides burtonii]